MYIFTHYTYKTCSNLVQNNHSSINKKDSIQPYYYLNRFSFSKQKKKTIIKGNELKYKR